MTREPSQRCPKRIALVGSRAAAGASTNARKTKTAPSDRRRIMDAPPAWRTRPSYAQTASGSGRHRTPGDALAVTIRRVPVESKNTTSAANETTGKKPQTTCGWNAKTRMLPDCTRVEPNIVLSWDLGNVIGEPPRFV